MHDINLKKEIEKFKSHRDYFLKSKLGQFRNQYVLNFIKDKDLNSKILNVGDGIGTISLEFEGFGFKNIFSIDIDEDFLNLAKKRCKFTKFKIDDAENLSFKNKSFDIITYVDVIEYLDIEKTIIHANRVLKKGGYIYLENFNIIILKYLKYLPFFSKFVKTHENYKLNSNFKVLKLLKKNNFKIIKYEYLLTEDLGNNKFKKMFYFLLKIPIFKKLFSPVCYFYAVKECD